MRSWTELGSCNTRLGMALFIGFLEARFIVKENKDRTTGRKKNDANLKSGLTHAAVGAARLSAPRLM